MGMFDSVYFLCLQCGKPIEVQSKAGSATMSNATIYTPLAVPPEIAGDMVGKTIYCDRCHGMFQIAQIVIPQTVRLGLIKKE